MPCSSSALFIPLSNISCFNDDVWVNLPPLDVLAVSKATSLLVLTMAMVFLNVVWVAVMKSKKYRSDLQNQVRCVQDYPSYLGVSIIKLFNIIITNFRSTYLKARVLLMALGLNSMLTGLTILLPAVATNLFPCWPLGDISCKIQVLC